jgi:hypothetical protein
MQNVISRNVSRLILQAQRAGQGLGANAEPLGLVLVSREAFERNLKNLIEARNAHALAKGTLRQKRSVLGTRVKRTRRFGMIGRELLKDVLGIDHSEAWIDAGYERSLAVPRAIAGLVRMAQGLKSHLKANPEHETGDLTAARANTILTELMDAVTAVDQQLSEVRELMNARDALLTVVRKDMQAITAELWVKADLVGPVWEDFGLKRPGILQSPGVPENITAKRIGPRTVVVRWNRPARARSYRIWRKIVGVDADWVLVESRTHLDITMENLPAGAMIEIAVSAMNNGGESAKSTIVTVTTEPQSQIVATSTAVSLSNYGHGDQSDIPVPAQVMERDSFGDVTVAAAPPGLATCAS